MKTNPSKTGIRIVPGIPEPPGKAAGSTKPARRRSDVDLWTRLMEAIEADQNIIPRVEAIDEYFPGVSLVNLLDLFIKMWNESDTEARQNYLAEMQSIDLAKNIKI